MDDIWWYGRSNVSYKIVTSAAFNYDHPIARAETYAAYRVLNDKIAFQVAMDQYAMGINFQIPARTVQPKRPELNDYVGRLSYLLQHGRHVADVAVLYPIASLQAAYRNVGGRAVPAGAERAGSRDHGDRVRARGRSCGSEADYQDIGEALFRGLRVDYTYLHPEVLVNRCSIENKKLVLNNRENREEYRVLILPGGDTLSAAAAAKIKEFYDKGGTVIATTALPTQSAEFGKDKEVQQAIADVFGVSPDGAVNADVKRAQDRENFYVFWYYIKKNAAGGQAIFLPNTHPWLLDFALKQVLPAARCRHSRAHGRPEARSGLRRRPDLHSQGEGWPRHLLLCQFIAESDRHQGGLARKQGAEGSGTPTPENRRRRSSRMRKPAASRLRRCVWCYPRLHRGSTFRNSVLLFETRFPKQPAGCRSVERRDIPANSLIIS